MRGGLLLGLALLHGWANACDVAPAPAQSPQGRWETFQRLLTVKNQTAACPSPAAPQLEQRCERIAAPLATVAALISAAQYSPSVPSQNGKGLSLRVFGLFDNGIWQGTRINLYPAGGQTLIQWTGLPLGSAAARLLGPLAAEWERQVQDRPTGKRPCQNVALLRQRFAPIATCQIEPGTSFTSPVVVLTVSGAVDDSLKPGIPYRYRGWSTCGPMFYRSP